MKCIKRIISVRLSALAVAVLMLLSLLPVYASEGGTVDIILGGTACRMGETVVIPVTVENNPGFTALTASLVYDETKLEFISASTLDLGGMLSADSSLVWTNIGDMTEDGQLIALTFRALADPDPTFSVSLSFGEGGITNIAEQTLYPNITPAEITLGSCEHKLETIEPMLPGCTYSGRTEGKACSVCGVITEYPQEIQPFGHYFVGGVCYNCGLEIDGTPSITVGSASAGQGGSVELDITIVNSPGICALTLTPVYDAEKLELTGVKFKNVGGMNSFDKNLVWINTQNITGTFCLATMKFNVIDPDFDRTEVSLHYKPGGIADIDENAVDFDIVSGTVTRICSEGHTYAEIKEIPATCTEPGMTGGRGCIYCGYSDMPPVEVPPLGHKITDGVCVRCGETSFPYSVGDTNGDGDVNVKDIVRLMKYISGADVEILNPDINGDGDVNVKDIVRLMKMVSSGT